MRIPITETQQRGLDSFRVKIKDVSHELEKITVRLLKFDTSHKSTSESRKIDVQVAGSEPTAKPSEYKDANTLKTVEIKLSIPKLKVPKIPSVANIKQKAASLPRKRLSLVAICTIVVLAAGIYYIINPSKQSGGAGKSNGGATNVTHTSNELEKGIPRYRTLLPAGRDISKLGGWTRVSPPSSDPVYAFVDQVGNAKLIVSEQPLPEDFKEDINGQVAELAKNYKATDKFSAGNITVHIGNSVKGPQSAIFSKADLLILIKTNIPLTNDQWAAYVSSLR